MDRHIDSFIDLWLEKWSSFRVDIKIGVKNFVNHIEVTVIFYHDTMDNTLSSTQFKIGSEFQYRSFKHSMVGFLRAYYKKYRETK